MPVTEIAHNVYSVGTRDWNRRMFDSLIPLPKGTSYNAYIVKGTAKNALIDTVNPGFEAELKKNMESVVGLKNIHYLIMNHGEPDHAGAIPQVMEATPAVLIASEKGAAIAEHYYKVSRDRIRVVKEGDSINLGGKTLQFIDAPWLHWPETIFTYIVEDKILFPCDFFGSHTAFGTFDTDSEDLISGAKRYFAEIMMPYKTMGAKAMEKLKKYSINTIAPSHGPIHTQPATIINEYVRWTAGETMPKALVVYASMWGSTRDMALAMADTLMAQDVQVALYDLAVSDIGEIAKDMVDARAIVLGSPTVLSGLHPLAAYALVLVKALRPPVKYAAYLGSYGWGAAGAKTTVEMLNNPALEIVGAIEVQGRPSADTMAKVENLATELAKRIKG